MSEQPTRHILLPRVFVEGAVIVISVLLALAADAWWDGRQARATEQVALLGLRSDLEATLQDIPRAREGYESAALAAERVIQLGASGPGDLSAAGMDSLLARVVTGTPFVPTDATLTSLLASDQLGIIRSLELRAQLSRWPRFVAGIQQMQEGSKNLFETYFMPYLYDRVGMRTLDAIGYPNLSTVPSAFARDARELLGDLRFENHVNDVLFFQRQQEDILTGLEAYIDSTLGLVQAAIHNDRR